MRYSLFVVLLLCSLLVQANRVKVKIFPVLKTSPAELVGNETRLPDFWLQQNQALQKIKDEFSSRREEIAYKIGSNQNVEVVTDAAPTMINFELVFSLGCIPDTEKDEDGEIINSEFYYLLAIDVVDPHTKKIVKVYLLEDDFLVENGSLTPDEQVDLVMELLLSDQLPRVDKIEQDIRNEADYHDAKIRYDQNMQVANGENKGRITVSGIRETVIGEAKSNPISSFVLKAEKGIFLKTNRHEVRFEGNEYYYGDPNSISFDYQTYNCSEYDDDKTGDTFTLIQDGQFNGGIEKQLTVIEIPFNCGFYDVYAHYSAPGFADAEVVWRNVQIVIQEDESEIPVLDADGDYEGENIPVPYAVQIPGYGKEIYYSWTESEYEIPEEINLKSFTNNTVCWIDKSEDGLNSCSIEKIPGGNIQLVLQFDLYIGEEIGDGEQITVGTDSDYPNAYTFPWKQIDSEIIGKLKSGQEVQKILQNQGGAKLTISFKPI